MTISHLRFGVLFLPVFQLLDATGPIDYINNHGKQFLEPFNSTLAAKAPTIEWHYISFTPDLTPVNATSGPPLIPTCTYADCPPFDYLLIPGPNDATLPLPEGCPEFLEKQLQEVKLFLTVCTASLSIAQTGILDGLHVASNKVEMKQFSENGILRKEVKWVGDRRWVKDGKVWSSGGITAGIDLAAEFARVNFDPEIVESVKLFSEYTPNPDQPDPFSGILEGVPL